MIRGQYRDILLLQPGNHRRIESCVFASSPPLVGTNFLAAGPHAGAHEYGITGQYLQSSLFQPRFDIFDVDRGARLEIFHRLELRDVDEYPAGEDSILEIVNRVFRVPVGLLHLFRVRLVAVVKYAVVVDVRKRVEMSMRYSVERDADPIGSECEHLVLIRLWVIDR